MAGMSLRVSQSYTYWLELGREVFEKCILTTQVHEHVLFHKMCLQILIRG